MGNYKVLKIIGTNYQGGYNLERAACRAVIIEDNKILLSCEMKNDIYMLPGGGFEDNENDFECVKRELIEETGNVIEPSNCVLQIDEYYGLEKYVNRYFLAKIISKAKRNLTPHELEGGLEPVWLDLDKVIDIFSKYGEKDGMTKGLYYREYMALKNIIGEENEISCI